MGNKIRRSSQSKYDLNNAVISDPTGDTDRPVTYIRTESLTYTPTTLTVSEIHY